jgi:CRP-like cAMP-binding protein
MDNLATLEVLNRFEMSTGLRLPNVHSLIDTIAIIELREKQSAFRENEVRPYVYIVRSGLLKQLYTKEDGTEWIKSFTGAGELFACPVALSPAGRTTFASVAIEASVVERIDYRLIEQMGETDLVWQKAIRFAFQYLADVKVRRERDLLMLSAAELYRKFVSDSPELAARVPQKDLAAFLGVTPVGLNRIIRGKR